MTTPIPDTWELPAYLAGELVPMKDYEDRRRERSNGWEDSHLAPVAPVVTLNDKMRRLIQRLRAERPAPEPGYDWAAAAERMRDAPAYDPSENPDRDFISTDSRDHLEQHGFEPTEDAGVWTRRLTHANGDPLAMYHTIMYAPGYRGSNKERAPWLLLTNPDSVSVPFRSVRDAVSAANADRDQVRKMSRLGSFLRALDRLMRKEAVEKTPAQIAAEKWLEEHSDDFEHWEPSPHDYTYTDFGDAAGQSFHGDEGHSHVLPGSAYDWEGQPRHQQDQSYWEDPAWSAEDLDAHEHVRQHAPTRGPHYMEDDEESGDLPEHEQDLADLGFNWQNRGDENTTPVGEHLRGEWVRGQHDPEGNYLGIHTLYEDPNGYSDSRWHLEHSPADVPDFVDSHTTHRFPSDAISRYHTNAEQALLPSRGYEPHYGRTNVPTHWTRVDTDPQSGAEYHHEIVAQPYAGEGREHQGWLGQTHASHFSRGYANGGPGTRNQNVQTDLADVVREHDRIGRGLHPGGSQDYRTTRNELLSDPSVARLGEPNWVNDSFYGDGKVGAAHWSLPHPNPPRQTVFDPTAPGHAREVESEHPINAEATYNWDKGGYDFAYTHDGQRIWPNSEHFPAGAPVHVPGRQTRIPLEH